MGWPVWTRPMSKALARFLLLLSTVLVLAFTGCSTPTETPAASIEGTVWSLVEVGGATVPVEEGVKHPDLTLELETKRVTGFAGVNTYGGTYKLEDTALSFGPLMMTRMAGPAPQMKLEQAFVAALAETTHWKITAERLVLLGEKDRVLVQFEAVEP